MIGGSGGKAISPSKLSSKEARVEAVSILRSSEVLTVLSFPVLCATLAVCTSNIVADQKLLSVCVCVR